MTDRREDFTHQSARTQRFRLGRPRGFKVSPDGERVVFLRSNAGHDPVNRLWKLDLSGGEEQLLFDPASLAAEAEEPPAEERARRERAREAASGVVDYSTDRDLTMAAFAIGGALHVVDLQSGEHHEPNATEPVFDPQIDPTGRRVAYVAAGELHVLDLDAEDRVLAWDADPDVSWGMAEFVAAEEMGRRHGLWWSPDGERLVATRVDEREVQTLYLSDPTEPAVAPRAARYPFAGTANADVSLWLIDLDGSRTDIRWDRAAFEYLARVVWPADGHLTLLVQSRDQRTTRLLAVEADGSTSVLHEEIDEAWVELVEGSPAWTDDSRIVRTVDDQDTRRLVVGGEVVTPPGLQVRRILDAGDGVLFVASEDPLEEHVWRWSRDAGAVRLTDEPGVHSASRGGETMAVTSSTLEHTPRTIVRRGEDSVPIESNGEEPVVDPRPILFEAGPRGLRCALFLPGGREPDASLPVLLDPYGGPGFQRVVRSRLAFAESQWFADQGFAVLVADGRGTPGRGVAWEKAVHLDLLGPAIDDQVEAVQAAGDRFGFLDRSRVAIRGWSFGGELAALSVLRHPDVFQAGIVGAPVTDPRLYDTHYTERYLGLPDEQPDAYGRDSILEAAPMLDRPVLIIQGMVDDNVLAANALRFSRALLLAGKPHTFLPLPGATHMANEVEIAEQLFLLELSFLQDALGIRP